MQRLKEISAADALARFRFRILNHSAMTAAALLRVAGRLRWTLTHHRGVKVIRNV